MSSSSKTSSWQCALLYIAAFLPLASVLRQHFGFPLDDSWIHQVIARNFANTHVLGFNPGRLSPGSTSLLWTLILTANTVVLPRLSPIVYCLLISVALFAWIGFSLKRLTEQDGLRGSASWAFAIAPALSANFLWFGLIGMEHLLFIALSLAWIRIWMQEGTPQGVTERMLLLLLPILLILTRPEGVFLVGLSVISMRLTTRRPRDSFMASLGAACGVALSCAVNWRVSGQLAPATMRGRQFLASSSERGHWIDRLLSLDKRPFESLKPGAFSLRKRCGTAWALLAAWCVHWSPDLSSHLRSGAFGCCMPNVFSSWLRGRLRWIYFTSFCFLYQGMAADTSPSQ